MFGSIKEEEMERFVLRILCISIIILEYIFYPKISYGSWDFHEFPLGEGQVGLFTSLDIDSNNKVHISCYSRNIWNFDVLKYATNMSGSWVLTSVDYANVYPELGGLATSSLSIDTNNSVHVSYYNDVAGYGGYLRYATNMSGSWVKTTLDTVRVVDLFTSLGIDTNNNIHIGYYGGDKDLKYATNAGGSWVMTTLDSTGVVGLYISLGIDSNNKVHISYYDESNGYLKYATNASGNWMTTTIDNRGGVGWYTSLGIDSSNNVHISYHDFWNGDLKYATNKSGAWITTIIDSNSTGDVGRHTSLKIDTNNTVHISYYDWANGDLKYATNVGGNWVITTLDSTGVVGWYSSIGTDNNNNVHISYYNESNGSLKYITNANQSAPIVTLNANPNSGFLPLSVEFTANAYDIDGEIVTYGWDFDGDRNFDIFTTDNTLSYTYGMAGTFNARVVVYDNDGAGGESVATITPIKLNSQPIGNIEIISSGSANRVDGHDLYTLSKAFGAKLKDKNWNSNCDLKEDLIIDGEDLVILANNFGKSQ